MYLPEHFQKANRQNLKLTRRKNPTGHQTADLENTPFDLKVTKTLKGNTESKFNELLLQYLSYEEWKYFKNTD